ncbi:hypothetical protein BP6252_10015 [Coleophoma cylindrospora]|uniref:Uncharacterized protein n=1 Tax=Coleophoma cylindrospora TaxID=1849047 RepID=A0A3D8QXG2_9HELO|nr:hypothetical protein BP6252_10015 [Coleophoma cylindrospora]
MVLENASDVVSDDQNPPSDNDPYNSSSNDSLRGQLSYHIDMSVLPAPIPIINGLLPYNMTNFNRALQQRLARSAEIVKRNPTQEEAQALAYWTARGLSIASYGKPLGLIGGCWRAYSTAATWRFPFWAPNPEKFSPLKLGPIAGPRAMLLWQFLRYSAYATLGNIVGTMFFASYGATVGAVGEMQDPRLKGFIEELRKVAQTQFGQRGPKGTRQQGSQQPDLYQQQNQYNREAADDASPTGGAFGDGFQSEAMQQAPVTPEPQAQQQQRSAPQSRWPVQRQSAPPTPTEPQPFDIFSDDDASPTGGQGMQSDMNTTASRSSSGSGSAWERLRANAQGASSRTATSQQPQDHEVASNSYAFSSADNDAARAREQAQKEFDARIERERNGGNFGGKRTGW